MSTFKVSEQTAAIRLETERRGHSASPARPDDSALAANFSHYFFQFLIGSGVAPSSPQLPESQLKTEELPPEEAAPEPAPAEELVRSDERPDTEVREKLEAIDAYDRPAKAKGEEHRAEHAERAAAVKSDAPKEQASGETAEANTEHTPDRPAQAQQVIQQNEVRKTAHAEAVKQVVDAAHALKEDAPGQQQQQEPVVAQVRAAVAKVTEKGTEAQETQAVQVKTEVQQQVRNAGPAPAAAPAAEKQVAPTTQPEQKVDPKVVQENKPAVQTVQAPPRQAPAAVSELAMKLAQMNGPEDTVKLPVSSQESQPNIVVASTQNFNASTSDKEASLGASNRFRAAMLNGADRQVREAMSTFGENFEKRVQTSDKQPTQLHRLPQSTQQKIVDQIRTALDEAKGAASGNKLVFRLDPPDLGAVTVKITQRGDQLFARIVPESPDVESVLRERAGEIVQLLGGSGVKSENIHLSIGREPAEHGWNAFGMDRGMQQWLKQGNEKHDGGGAPSHNYWHAGASQTESGVSVREGGGWVA